jgi:hypothetical protein
MNASSVECVITSLNLIMKREVDVDVAVEQDRDLICTGRERRILTRLTRLTRELWPSATEVVNPLQNPSCSGWQQSCPGRILGEAEVDSD